MAIWLARSYGDGDNGLTRTTQVIIIVFLSLSLSNFIELICMIFMRFRRYTGLYFWAFLVATGGIPINVAGYIVKFFGPPSLGYFAATLDLVGWICMVSGQSLVLWSRLHLVMRNQRYLRMTLWLIVIDGIICHGTVIPMVYGSFSSHPEIWQKPYEIMERIEVTVFFLQEVFLSGLYIVEAVKLMRLQESIGNTRSRLSGRCLMRHLIVANILIIILDITLINLEYANQYNMQITYKIWAYSVKLKLEFTILNRLVKLTTIRSDNQSFINGAGGASLSGTSSQAYITRSSEGPK